MISGQFVRPTLNRRSEKRGSERRLSSRVSTLSFVTSKNGGTILTSPQRTQSQSDRVLICAWLGPPRRTSSFEGDFPFNSRLKRADLIRWDLTHALFRDSLLVQKLTSIELSVYWR